MKPSLPARLSLMLLGVALALARANGLAVIDLAPAIAGLAPQKLWVMPDDAHPNAEAHRRFAQALSAVLP